ncbi:hypothetical protein C8Q76DRAFT_692837 [Earliella scabrosa]|nr:hypothetical protein C8Q76DRAFT_692837 [Earliella scabrosa]
MVGCPSVVTRQCGVTHEGWVIMVESNDCGASASAMVRAKTGVDRDKYGTIRIEVGRHGRQPNGTREKSVYTATLRLAAFGLDVRWQETGKREVEEVRRVRQTVYLHCRDESSETLSGRGRQTRDIHTYRPLKVVAPLTSSVIVARWGGVVVLDPTTIGGTVLRTEYQENTRSTSTPLSSKPGSQLHKKRCSGDIHNHMQRARPVTHNIHEHQLASGDPNHPRNCTFARSSLQATSDHPDAYHASASMLDRSRARQANGEPQPRSILCQLPWRSRGVGMGNQRRCAISLYFICHMVGFLNAVSSGFDGSLMGGINAMSPAYQDYFGYEAVGASTRIGVHSHYRPSGPPVAGAPGVGIVELRERGSGATGSGNT